MPPSLSFFGDQAPGGKNSRGGRSYPKRSAFLPPVHALRLTAPYGASPAPWWALAGPRVGRGSVVSPRPSGAALRLVVPAVAAAGALPIRSSEDVRPGARLKAAVVARNVSAARASAAVPAASRALLPARLGATADVHRTPGRALVEAPPVASDDAGLAGAVPPRGSGPAAQVVLAGRPDGPAAAPPVLAAAPGRLVNIPVAAVPESSDVRRFSKQPRVEAALAPRVEREAAVLPARVPKAA